VCYCHICGLRLNIQILVDEEETTTDDRLGYYEEDCVLADTIHDVLNNIQDIYRSTPDRSSHTQKASTPPTSQAATSISENLPASTAPSPTPHNSTSDKPPTSLSTSSPRPATPERMSYAAVAAAHTQATSPPDPKTDQAIPSTTSASPGTGLFTNSRHIPITPRIGTKYRYTSPSPFPVLSIYDLCAASVIKPVRFIDLNRVRQSTRTLTWFFLDFSTQSPTSWRATSPATIKTIIAITSRRYSNSTPYKDAPAKQSKRWYM
jgi:hypothetical protein